MTIESDLKLLAMKRQSTKKDNQQLKTQYKAPQSRRQSTQLSKKDIQLTEQNTVIDEEKPNLTPVVPSRSRMNSELIRQIPRRPAPTSRDIPLETEQLISMENELRFDHIELLNVWGRYKPIANQSSDDKIDRLGKVVGNLKINLRSILSKEKEATINTNLALHPEYVKLMEQVTSLKMANEELHQRNRQLSEENRSLRQIMAGKIQLKDQHTVTQTELVFQNEEFKILKVWKDNGTRIRRNSLDSSAKNTKPQLTMAQLIRYTHLLQEGIVDGLNSNYESPLMKSHCRNRNESSIKQQHNISTKVTKEGKHSSEEMSTNSEINSTSNLQQIGGKLAELRTQRLKAFDDEDLWKQIEHIKL